MDIRKIMLAQEMASRLSNIKYQAGNTNYTEYSPIYLTSTSNVKDTMKLYKDSKDVLVMGGTGAHGYEALLNGANSVDMFDINELQRLFYEYMNTAIKVLSYEEFIKYFTLKRQSNVMLRSELNDLISYELYEKLVYSLPTDVNTVLGPLFEYKYNFDLIMSSLFRFEHPISLDYLKKFISMYNEEDYYKLQNILRNNDHKINYYQVSLLDVPNYFKDKKYDLIALDNILQYYYNIKEINKIYNVNMFINKNLSSLLNENGIIQAGYGFEVATDILKVGLGLIEYKDSYFNRFPKSIYKNESKKEINYQLVKNWDNYSYNFIPGVEREKSDNVVLTYRKVKKKK